MIFLVEAIKLMNNLNGMGCCMAPLQALYVVVVTFFCFFQVGPLVYTHQKTKKAKTWQALLIL